MTWEAIDYDGATQTDGVEIGGEEYRREVTRLRFSVAVGAINRETVRDAFVALLQTALVGSGLPASAVYGYQVGDFAGKSPVVVVSSAGSDRGRATFQGSFAYVYLNVYAFVLYTDRGSWNEDNAEDRLDLIEKTIADVIDANQRA